MPPQKDVGKYVLFVFYYESGRQQLVRDDVDLDLPEIEKKLVVLITSYNPASYRGQHED